MAGDPRKERGKRTPPKSESTKPPRASASPTPRARKPSVPPDVLHKLTSTEQAIAAIQREIAALKQRPDSPVVQQRMQALERQLHQLQPTASTVVPHTAPAARAERVTVTSPGVQQTTTPRVTQVTVPRRVTSTPPSVQRTTAPRATQVAAPSRGKPQEFSPPSVTAKPSDSPGVRALLSAVTAAQSGKLIHLAPSIRAMAQQTLEHYRQQASKTHPRLTIAPKTADTSARLRPPAAAQQQAPRRAWLPVGGPAGSRRAVTPVTAHEGERLGLPSFATGGLVSNDGAAVVHPSEYGAGGLTAITGGQQFLSLSERQAADGPTPTTGERRKAASVSMNSPQYRAPTAQRSITPTRATPSTDASMALPQANSDATPSGAKNADANNAASRNNGPLRIEGSLKIDGMTGWMADVEGRLEGV